MDGRPGEETFAEGDPGGAAAKAGAQKVVKSVLDTVSLKSL